MKFYKIIFCIFLFIFYSCLNTSKVKSPSRYHEGKWKGNLLDGKEIVIILDSSGYAKLYMDKKIVNPNNSKEIYYAIDYKNNPIFLDIIFYDREKESIVIKCIIDFLSNNIMRFSTNFNHIRPSIFEENNTIILKRVN